MVRISADRTNPVPNLVGPIDVNLAPAEQLLRVPGVGPRTVERLLIIRRSRRIRLRDLQRLHVGLRRAKPLVITADHRPAPLAGSPPEQERNQPGCRQLPLFEHDN